MIFEQETMGFQILDVLSFNQGSTKKYNFKRNFDALSFRLHADTVIEFGGTQLEFSDNSIGFFPSNVDYTRISNRDCLIVVHFKSFQYHSNEIERFLPSEPEKYKVLFYKILECWNQKDISYKHHASSLLNQIFAELYHDNKKSYEHTSKLKASIQYIDENYMKKDFSLQTAAEKSYISDTYFRKLFKQEFHLSPKQYVIKRRMNHAASLIIAGYHTLEEIAELCGYHDYKHFSVAFKKVIGTSPSKYVYNYAE